MDQAIQQAMTWPVILFCFGILVITALIKRFVNTVFFRYPWIHADLQFWWKRFILPSLPLIVGGVAAWLMTKYPYPAMVQSNGVRVFFGMGCGLCCGFLYGMAKTIFELKGAKNHDPLADEESKSL